MHRVLRVPSDAQILLTFLQFVLAIMPMGSGNITLNKDNKDNTNTNSDYYKNRSNILFPREIKLQT